MPLLLLLAACTLRPTPAGPSPAELRARTPAPQWFPGEPSVVRALALVHAGSAFDPIGFEGLSYRAARALLYEPELQREGLSLSVDVGREWVLLQVSGSAELTPEALDLMADALTWGAPSVDAVTQAAADAEAELAAIEGDAGRLAAEALQLWVYEGHPYGHPVPGRRGVAELLTAQEVAAHRARTWVRSAVHVGVLGAPRPPALDSLEDALSPLSAERGPRPLPATWPRVDGRSLLIVESDLPLTGLAIGQPLNSRAGPLDTRALARSASAFQLGDATLQPSSADFDRHRQPALRLSLPAMPAALTEETLRGALRALEAWRAEPPDGLTPPPSPAEEALQGLLDEASGRPDTDAFDVLPGTDEAFVVVVTDEPNRLTQALVEENTDAPVKAADTPGLDPLSFSSTTRTPQEGLFR